LATGILLLFGLIAVVYRAWRASGSGRDIMLPVAMLVSGFIFMVMLVTVNRSIPFAAMSGGMGGDDYNYFQSSLRELPTLGSWFNLNQFPAFEQGGYPLVLTWVNQFADDSLVARKGLNVLFYLLIAIVWYEIGLEMGGRRFARAFSLAILLGSPFWTYWIYLLKDMTIVLLQSLFLLGVVRLVVLPHRNRGQWLLIITVTLLLIPFRIALVVLNSAVLGATIVVLSHRSTFRKVLMIAAGSFVLAGLYVAGSNAAALGALGVRGTGRSLTQLQLSYEALTQQTLSEQRKFAGVRGALVFPVLFIIGETTGFRPNEAFRTFGPEAGRDIVLRGVVAVPWIFFGTPFFTFGLLRLLRRHRGSVRGAITSPSHVEVLSTVHSGTRAASSWAVSVPTSIARRIGGDISAPRETPQSSLPQLATFDHSQNERRAWIPLLFFLGVYAVVAWVVRDTTRWRMPAFPVMLAIAVNGMLFLSARRRVLVAASWTAMLTFALVIYYFAK
jgi:hypothetical protein